jgi:uncharacterized iron-regulated protein
MHILKKYIIFSILFSSLAVFANPADRIFSQGLKEVSLNEALSTVKPGQVVILGEEHGSLIQAGQQVSVLKALRNAGLKVSLGMEFFEFPQQSLVDGYHSGALNEADFLQAIKWGGFPFDAYREQVKFPRFGDEFLIALNAPRSLTGRIAKVGWDGLTEGEKSLLPPGLQLGNAGYRARFEAIMGGHVPAAALERYFQAQCTWDDTMAHQASQFVQRNPDQVLVIIVGEFHVQYGGGLPDRLRARGIQPLTFSLVNLEGLSTQETVDAIQPSKTEGPRADFVWTSQFPR